MMFKLLVILPWLLQITSSTSPRIAKPGCQDKCGNHSIPYPFGIGLNCYHNPWFNVNCSDNSGGMDINSVSLLSVSEIKWDPVNGDRNLVAVVPCYRLCDTDGNPWQLVTDSSLNLTGSPFLFSRKHNVLVVDGCGGGVIMRDRTNKTIAGCATVCTSNTTKPGVDCYGVDCCQTTMSSSVDYYSLEFLSMGHNRIVEDSSSCTRAVLVDTNWIANKKKNLEHFQGTCDPAYVVLEWTVKDLPVNSTSYANSSCVNKTASVDDAGGFVCRCKQFYEGNPYLPHGCQVVRGCEGCVQDCISLENNTFGCPQKAKRVNTKAIAVGLGLGISFVMLLVILGAYWLYQVIKGRRNIRLKAKYFKRNGGLLLKQQMSSEDNNVETTRIWASDELQKATDSYNEDRILGQGGQGTVYKGMLSDGKIVAIKKSKVVDESQLNVFINEVFILSKINHRNVVKLLGCCLETEVPMLVYEYIPNGTLSQYLHALKEDFPISWEIRLQIATDIANALAYLHSSYLIPIFHRDIKSSNILLDSKYRAKLSDFGISKSLGIDQTHITTCVVGTFGYLDPEYFQTNQFTDKSDVYSFGVVLVELLTGQKAIRSTEDDEERGLVAWFFAHMENSRLYAILDARVLKEGGQEEILIVADVAKRCLSLDGKKRPAMKEVAAELETVRSSMQQGLMKIESASTRRNDESLYPLINISVKH